MKKERSYQVLDAEGGEVSLKAILTSSSDELVLVRKFSGEPDTARRTVATFRVAEYGDHQTRNMECFHLCTRILGHDVAIKAASTLLTMLRNLRAHATSNPAGALAMLQEGDITACLARMGDSFAVSQMAQHG